MSNSLQRKTKHQILELHMLCESLSRARLFATPWTAAHQAPLSMRFSRPEYWSGLPFPSPELYIGYGNIKGFSGSIVVKNPLANIEHTGDMGSISEAGRSPGERKGYPLQYPCLENPTYREARWATVHGVSKSQTRFSD